MHPQNRTIQSYDRIAGLYSSSHNTTHFWKGEFETYTQLLPSGKILDIGCGTGRDTQYFLEKGYDYTGIDPSQGMLAEARHYNSGATFLPIPVEDIDFSDSPFDGFWATASLLHIPKDAIGDVLFTLRKNIRTGAIGFITMKSKQGNQDEGWVIDRRYAEVERFFAFYNPVEFTDLLESAHFQIISSHIRTEGETDWLCYFVRS